MTKLILTGFMATGKSTVARRLARQLTWRLIDCDAEISARTGKSIEEIFRDHGEAHFRALERDFIREIASDKSRCAQCGKLRPAVIATGGGAIIDPQNYAVLSQCGMIICLTARPEVILRRIARNVKARPMLLQGATPPKQRIGELMDARREAYARAALTIDTSERTVEQVTDEILSALTENYPSVSHDPAKTTPAPDDGHRRSKLTPDRRMAGEGG
jgi:shikimate kinase